MTENPRKNPLSNFNVTDMSLTDVPAEYIESLVSLQQISRATGLSKSAISYMRRRGEIPFIRLPNGTHRYPPYVINTLSKRAKITVYEPKQVDNDDDIETGGVLDA